MGNYYEGTLRFFIRKDIPKEDFNDLKLMNDRCDQKESYSEKLQNSRWFQHERWDRVYTDLFHVCHYDGDDADGYCLLPVDEIDIPADITVVGYLFEVRICTKGYRTDGNDLGEAIVDYLIGMCDLSLYEDDIGMIGRVNDEDETYDREFHIDEEAFKKEQEKKKFLCEGCRFWSEKLTCEEWDRCYRAYMIGCKENN